MTLGGFEQAGRLLEFDQVLAQVASYCRTALGREKVAALEPSEDLLEVATRQQETTETRRFIDGGGSLEFGPENDITELIQRAMLGGLLRGDELYAVRAFARAARYDRDELSRPSTGSGASARSGDDLPLLSSLASNIPELGHLDSEIGAAISPAGEVLDYASPLLGRLRAESRQAQNRLNEIMERNLRRFQRSEVVQEPLITQRNGRMVLLIKTEMRYRVPGIVHDVSDSGATVFVEPMAAVDMGKPLARGPAGRGAGGGAGVAAPDQPRRRHRRGPAAGPGHSCPPGPRRCQGPLLRRPAGHAAGYWG